MKDRILVISALAILSITGLGIVGLLTGHNSNLLTYEIGTIGTIVGVNIGKAIPPSKPPPPSPP